MKNLILTFLLIGVTLFAQRSDRHSPREKLGQLEKIKLIEFLNLDETTSLKFFARKNSFERKTKELFRERESILESFGKEVIDSEEEWDNKKLEESYNRIWEIEKKIFDIRAEFYNSLDDILSPEQRLKLLGFEHRFRREIQKLMRNKFKD